MRFTLKPGQTVTISITSQEAPPQKGVAYSPGLDGSLHKRSAKRQGAPVVAISVKEDSHD